MSTLYELTDEYLQLLEMIEQGDVDEELLNDTLEGIGGEIEVKADGYAKVILELTGDLDKLGKEISRLQAKKQAIDNSIKGMKKSLEEAMRTTGKVKFKTDLFSFGIQKNPASLHIDDPSAIPAEYLIPQEPKVDNAAIKKMLKEIAVPWAHLEQTESLRIR